MDDESDPLIRFLRRVARNINPSFDEQHDAKWNHILSNSEITFRLHTSCPGDYPVDEDKFVADAAQLIRETESWINEQ